MATFWLEYEQNGNLQKFPFDAQSVSIGRDKSSDFVLDHPTVSRQHAIITHDGRGNFRFVSLSRGGLTAIERVPVQGEVELYDGATLHIGQLWFRFRSDYAAKRAPASAPGGYGNMGNAGGQAPGGFGGMVNAGGPAPGGFGGMGNAGGQAPGGFGGQAPGGFGSMGGAPEQGAGSFGSFGSMGGPPDQGAGSFGSFGSMGGAPPPGGGPPKSGNDAGIVSWDEIAQSKEATQDEEQPSQASDFERISAAGADKEKTNPLLVVVGVVLAVGMLGYVFLGDDSGSGSGDATEFNMSELPVVELSVSCLAEPDCMRQAESAYVRGIDLIEKQDVENRNLFDGYVRMLEARQFLAEANYQGIPESMKALEATESAARAALDRKFREFRVQFHQAQQKGDGPEMVRVLNSIIVFFPERTAREHRWAANKELEMKRNGMYPRSQ